MPTTEKRLQKRSQSLWSQYRECIEVKTVCEICGCTGKMNGHHQDYKDPYIVNYLCTRCHRQVHAVVDFLKSGKPFESLLTARHHPGFYTTQELADYLGTSKTAVRHWCLADPPRIPAPTYQIGRNNRRLWSQAQADEIKTMRDSGAWVEAAYDKYKHVVDTIRMMITDNNKPDSELLDDIWQLVDSTTRLHENVIRSKRIVQYGACKHIN